MTSDFGDMVRRRRQALRLSVRAVEARTGVNYTFISLLERGRRHPSRDSVQALIDGLGLNPREAYEAAGYSPPEPYRLAAVMVPIYASIPAGTPTEVDDVPEGFGYLPEGEVAGRLLYYVRVGGESLRDAGIKSGDLILVDASQREARAGQLIVARVGTESMLRYWHPENAHAILRSANGDYPDIHATGVEILGVALGTFQRF